MKWTKDPKAESGMRRLDIPWTIETVPMRCINREMSADRQARVGKKLNDDWIMEYALAATQGAEFPMPILDKLKRDSYFIWSGNHRIGAADLNGDLEIQAYVVHVTDMRLMDILPRVVNTWEGHRESREAVLVHAAYVCETHALDPAEVADMFSLKYEWLSQALRASGVRRQVEATGVKIDIPTSGLVKLSPISGNKNVLQAVVKLFKAHDVAPTGEQALQIINDVKGKATERDQLAEVTRWHDLFKKRKEKPAAPKVPFSRGKRSKIISLLQNLDKFLAGITTATQLQLDDTDVQIVTESWASILGKMTKLTAERKAERKAV